MLRSPRDGEPLPTLVLELYPAPLAALALEELHRAYSLHAKPGVFDRFNCTRLAVHHGRDPLKDGRIDPLGRIGLVHVLRLPRTLEEQLGSNVLALDTSCVDVEGRRICDRWPIRSEPVDKAAVVEERCRRTTAGDG